MTSRQDQVRDIQKAQEFLIFQSNRSTIFWPNHLKSQGTRWMESGLNQLALLTTTSSSYKVTKLNR